MTIELITSIAMLVERGLISYSAIKAMQESGISNQQILATVNKLQQKFARHQDFDLRKPEA